MPADACTEPTVRQLVDQFIGAFNTGSDPALQRVWADSGQGFGWYTTDAPGERTRPAALDRHGLTSYFASRHDAGESLQLTSFQFNGNSLGYGSFQYTLIREADDLSPTEFLGKGAAICGSTPRLIVWSMSPALSMPQTTSAERTGCGPPSRIIGGDVEGTPTDLGTRLASLIGKVRAGEETKLVFRITGEGPVRVDLLDATGRRAELAWGPTAHTSSNFVRPGREWGVGFVIPEPGCWEVRIATQTSSRSIGSASIGNATRGPKCGRHTLIRP
jgi:hypothetical protein